MSTFTLLVPYLHVCTHRFTFDIFEEKLPRRLQFDGTGRERLIRTRLIQSST